MDAALRAGGTERSSRAFGLWEEGQTMEFLTQVIILALFAGAAVAIANSILDAAGISEQLKGIPVVGQYLDAILVILLVWALDLSGFIPIGRDNEFVQTVVDGIAIYSVIAMANAIRDGFAAGGVIVEGTAEGAVWELASDFDASKLEALR